MVMSKLKLNVLAQESVPFLKPKHPRRGISGMHWWVGMDPGEGASVPPVKLDPKSSCVHLQVRLGWRRTNPRLEGLCASVLWCYNKSPQICVFKQHKLVL